MLCVEASFTKVPMPDAPTKVKPDTAVVPPALRLYVPTPVDWLPSTRSPATVWVAPVLLYVPVPASPMTAPSISVPPVWL